MPQRPLAVRVDAALSRLSGFLYVPGSLPGDSAQMTDSESFLRDSRCSGWIASSLLQAGFYRLEETSEVRSYRAYGTGWEEAKEVLTSSLARELRDAARTGELAGLTCTSQVVKLMFDCLVCEGPLKRGGRDVYPLSTCFARLVPAICPVEVDTLRRRLLLPAKPDTIYRAETYKRELEEGSWWITRLSRNA